jgi:hypothetical protein
MIVIIRSSHANVFPGGVAMEKVGEFAGRFFLEARPLLDWAIRNWAITVVVLALLIYWAGKQKTPRSS